MEDVHAAFCGFLATVDNATAAGDIDPQEARLIAELARKLAKRMDAVAEKQTNRT